MEVTEVTFHPEASPGRCRLEADVVYADATRERLWYDFPARLAPTINRTGDPWIIALAPLAVTLGEPLIVRQAADPRLVEGVRQAARIWKVWDPSLASLELTVPVEDRDDRRAPLKTASLFSGGVDSWHTVLRNHDEAEAGRGFRIDSLLLIWGADIALTKPEAFAALRQRLQQIACELRCDLVDVATNLRETRWKQTAWADISHGSFFAAAVHATGAFGRCYIPSSVTYNLGRAWGSHPLTDPLFSSRLTALVYDGAEVSRVDKTARVVRSDLALGSLRVCWRSGTDRNCGKCMKCLRTMIALELHDAMPRATTFPVQRLDPGRVARITAEGARVKMLRNLTTEALAAGRGDIARALERAQARSARLRAWRRVLIWLDARGIRGATRLRLWLERDSIVD